MENIIANGSNVNRTAEGKPCLVVEPGKLDSLADQAMQILTDEAVDIFQRGGKLVRPIVQEGVDNQGNPVHFPVLQEVGFAFLRKMLSRHIEWRKPDMRTKKGPSGKGFRRIEAPKEIAEAIMSNAGFWTFRTVAGIISTPTLRFDGSVLSEPGYDPRTHLYLQTDVALPPIPASPTRADAERALALLEDLLTEFPFVNDASRSVELSAMLSTVARSMFDVCPAHGSRAPAPGTGKSYLSDVVSAIILGEKCPVISVSADNEGETEKRVVGAALSGLLIINFDNVNGTLGGDALCQLTERPIMSLRPLGQSDQVRVENRSIVFFNGNNCRVHGDMTRRVLLADLDAGVERPAERKFKNDPVAKVRKNRGTYIAACMTVLRAFIMAGRPEQKITPMNSYDQWSGTVRSALVWLNRADPCLTVQKVRDEDPELQRLAAFIAAARLHIEGKESAMAASDLVKKAQQGTPSGTISLHGQREMEPLHPDLYDFTLGFLGRNGKPDARRLGVWLSQNTHRIISTEDTDGKPTIRLRIAKTRDTNRNLDKWFLENVTPKVTGSTGTSGSNFQSHPKNCTAQILRMDRENLPELPEFRQNRDQTMNKG
jgi:putative DNA primase/helicase